MITRREILKTGSSAGATIWLAPNLMGQEGTTTGADSLKGFILSDAHFGWDNQQQPAPFIEPNIYQDTILIPTILMSFEPTIHGNG